MKAYEHARPQKVLSFKYKLYKSSVEPSMGHPQVSPRVLGRANSFMDSQTCPI